MSQRLSSDEHGDRFVLRERDRGEQPFPQQTVPAAASLNGVDGNSKLAQLLQIARDRAGGQTEFIGELLHGERFFGVDEHHHLNETLRLGHKWISSFLGQQADEVGVRLLFFFILAFK